MNNKKYSYDEAFCRNLGLISQDQQNILRNSTVGIAGCGGMGGAHAHTLARLGVGGFKLSDPDVFEPANFNRQFGATLCSIGRQKVWKIASMINAINPEASVDTYPTGITKENVAKFISDCDLIMDGIDFFELATRRMLFAEAYRQSVPVVTAAPIGFDGNLLIIKPDSPSLEVRCRFQDSRPKEENLLRFLAAVAPTADLRIFDPAHIDMASGKVPSSIIGITSASAKAAAAAMEILINEWSKP